MEHLCAVCSEVVGNAHKCSICNKFVHIICGITKGECFGQKMKCINCLQKGMVPGQFYSILHQSSYHRHRLTLLLFKTHIIIHSYN